MTEPDSTCAPVLLIGFNRPDFMRDQIAAVRVAKPAKLYLAVDGPREGRPEEAAKCAAVRDCVKLVDWPCDVKTLFREKNLGCKYGVSGAITWFFENEEMGIVLEDDCRPSPDFFRFASEMLVRYKDDERIGAVCGFNGGNMQSASEPSYHFSAHMEVWGWASWRRVWNHYNVDINNSIAKIDHVLSRSSLTPRAKHAFKALFSNPAIDTWDIQFSLMFMERNYISVIPSKRLVANIGQASSDATHTGGYNYFAARWAQVCRLPFPLKHPSVVEIDYAADTKWERLQAGLLPRTLTWIGSRFENAAFHKILSSIGMLLENKMPFLMSI